MHMLLNVDMLLLAEISLKFAVFLFWVNGLKILNHLFDFF